MKKKQLKIPATSKDFTYFLKRMCEYCDEPIEDQARPNRKHCLPKIDEFGVEHSCKRLKHSVKHEREDELLMEYIARAKNHNKMISKMLADHGDHVTSQMIDAYGICLRECTHFDFDGHQYTSHFIDFTIYSNPNTDTHRIVVTKN
jgi:hypothetical protein